MTSLLMTLQEGAREAMTLESSDGQTALTAADSRKLK